MVRNTTLSLLVAVLLNAGLIMGCGGPAFSNSNLLQDKPGTPNREEKRLLSSLPRTVVLDYEDFGPQAMAYELIGYEWNQWKNEGHELPDDVEVKVVVYRGIRLGKVKGAYPVVRGRSDYRYVKYDHALRFLDTQIGKLEATKKEESEANLIKMWDDLITTLKSTRAAIVRGLA
jgi:hypothetical protein